MLFAPGTASVAHAGIASHTVPSYAQVRPRSAEFRMSMLPPPLPGLPEANTYHFSPGPPVSRAGSWTSRSPRSTAADRAGAAPATGAARAAARASRTAVRVASDARRTSCSVLPDRSGSERQTLGAAGCTARRDTRHGRSRLGNGVGTGPPALLGVWPPG